MERQTERLKVSQTDRVHLLRTLPNFSTWNEAALNAFAQIWHEVEFKKGDYIVIENELVDSVYLIVSGEALVTHAIKKRKKIIETPLATLSTQDAIGLTDTGFYSQTGKRTASVIANTEMLLLRLNINDLYAFLKEHDLEHSMYDASLQMQRMLFIKLSLPFAKISHERLRWLSDHVEEITIKKDEILFHQGEEGDKCYLVRKGRIEITMRDENNIERCLAILKPPALFGEATLISHLPRNATAIALEESELFVLDHALLSEVIESEENVAHMFMNLMVDRSLPLQNANVSMHQRQTADGATLTILKNSDTGSYFKLSREGAYIWKQLDGKHTLQDITLKLAEKHNIFAPDIVAALISKLTKAGYIKNIKIDTESEEAHQPIWLKSLFFVKQILEKRVAFGDADKWITYFYKRFFHYFFTTPGYIFLGLAAIFGFVAFVMTTPDVLLFFSFKHASLFLLFGLIPLGILGVFLHELGHAFAVKAYGYEVHYIGVGWYWLTPIAFTDTSDMWLATRKPRMLVNFAGVYVDIILAGLTSIIVFFIDHPYIQCMLWLFAFYMYIHAFRMLSPLQDMDGYYILMDWLEINRLRQKAVLWLLRTFPKTLRHPKLFHEHRAEVSYWIACLFYLACVSGLTLLVQLFVFYIFGIEPANPYLILVLPFLIVIFSSLGIIAQIRNQREE